MLDVITKHSRTIQNNFTFCLLIPTWNNIDYLKNCIHSIQKNSSFISQIIIIINEGVDGTLDWVASQTAFDYIYAKRNVGICYSLNIARSMIKSDYIIYLNDDMYVLPDWDRALYNEIKQLNTNLFMLSSTMIEPIDNNNPCVVVKYFGTDLKSFKEEQILKEYKSLAKKDWYGSMWPPNVMHIDLWDLVGGMSIEYSPGMYSDPDLNMKLYKVGVRIFKGVGTSLVYHFGSKTTNRILKNKGRKIFILKWDISANFFRKQYLKHGLDYTEDLKEPKINFVTSIQNKIKKFLEIIH